MFIIHKPEKCENKASSYSRKYNVNLYGEGNNSRGSDRN